MSHEEEFSKKVMNAVYTFIGIPASLLLAAMIVAVGGGLALVAIIACLVLLGAGAAAIKHRETVKKAWRLRDE
jgi:hypothetical protein